MADIYPLRLGAVRGALFNGIDGDPAAELNVLKRMVEKGLRAQLRTGNLLTGQLFVALDFAARPSKTTATVADGTLDLPTMPGTLSEVQSQVAEIVQKMSKVPFEEIGTNLAATLGQANAAIAQLTPEARKALAEASAAIAQLTPEAKKALTEVERTLARAQASLDSLDRNVTQSECAAAAQCRGDDGGTATRRAVVAHPVRLPATSSGVAAARQARRPGVARRPEPPMNRSASRSLCARGFAPCAPRRADA